LSIRIKKICELISPKYTIIDIGCDHGLVSEFIVKNGLATKLIACDVSISSLNKAKTLLGPHLEKGAKDVAVEFMCCDGADIVGIVPTNSLAIIAGLGGREMLKIVRALRLGEFILAPQNCQKELRWGMYELGYRASTDKTIKDKNKFYDVMLYGLEDKPAIKEPNLKELLYGFDYKKSSSDLKARLELDKKQILSYNKLTDENSKKLKIIEEILQCQQ